MAHDITTGVGLTSVFVWNPGSVSPVSPPGSVSPVRDANKTKPKQPVAKLKTDMRELLKGDKLPDGSVRRTNVGERLEDTIKALDAHDPSQRMNPEVAVEKIRTIVIEELEVKRNEKNFPGSEVFTEVDVYAETGISLEKFAKMNDDDKQGMTRKEVNGVVGVYKKVTDIDVLVVNGSKAQRMEQIKTGVNDRPGAAASQNNEVFEAIKTARSKGEKLVFVTNSGQDLTGKVDASSLTPDVSVTVGPENAGFKESLDYVAADFQRTIKELVSERGVEPADHKTKGNGGT